MHVVNATGKAPPHSSLGIKLNCSDNTEPLGEKRWDDTLQFTTHLPLPGVLQVMTRCAFRVDYYLNMELGLLYALNGGDYSENKLSVKYGLGLTGGLIL